MEDYKKKYEDALVHIEWIKETNKNNSELVKFIESRFPELKESKDEQIRKSLIHYFSEQDGIFTAINGSISIKDIIAWLEKQRNNSIVTHILTKAGLKPYKDGNKWCILVGDNIQDGICGFGDTVDEALYEFLKELIEIVNIKPKFEVGDWVVHNETGDIHQIKQCIKFVNAHAYAYDLTDGGYINIFRTDDYHLWTINDAKDGDILAVNDTVVIFKDLYNTSTFHSYCHIENGIFRISKNDMPDWWQGKKFRPANIEQGELLFKTMNKAGYVWDPEHKELKQLKQNTACNEKYIADIFEKVGLAKIVREKGSDELTCAVQDAMIELSKFIQQ